MVAADEQQKLGKKFLKHQAEVDAKFHTKVKKAAEIKKPGSAQQHRAAAALKEVAERGNETRRTVVA